ncbi:hypothetical protein RJ640_025742 [Escallonia rubra]|uniref:Uncharacterized protein n=1 Tax=Escallonia rubra TaxID=112253 RepID=A0AA88RXM1_9ASTE|nr:hypothetical protein RJ640_025742 [Escallonia rubra]
MTWNLVISFSRGGQFSLITGTSEKSCIHVDNSGFFSSSITFRPTTSSKMLTKLAIQPTARSRYPMVSPPKNFFPFSCSSSNFRFSMAVAVASSCSLPCNKGFSFHASSIYSMITSDSQIELPFGQMCFRAAAKLGKYDVHFHLQRKIIVRGSVQQFKKPGVGAEESNLFTERAVSSLDLVVDEYEKLNSLAAA